MNATNVQFPTGEKNQRILVTGGGGFIGSHLCSRLLSRGYEVFCLDNFFTGSRENVAPLMGHPNFRLLEQDICLPIHLKVGRIYNLACPASPIHYQADPIFTTRTSVLGALNMLELARETGAVVLQASTSEVYGDPAVHPQTESYWGNVNPMGPRSCYDVGKRCAESLFFDYHRKHRVKIKVARLFNTYGPHMQPNDGRIVSNVLMQALQNKPLTIFGDGRQTRSFCFVSDMVDALNRLCDSQQDFTGPVNLGNPEEMTILELVERVLEMTNSRSTISFRSLPQDDPRRRRPDIALATRELGWRPTTSIQEGLRRTAIYFETLLRLRSSRAESDFRHAIRTGRVLPPETSRSAEASSCHHEAAPFSLLSEKPRSGPH